MLEFKIKVSSYEHDSESKSLVIKQYNSPAIRVGLGVEVGYISNSLITNKVSILVRNSIDDIIIEESNNMSGAVNIRLNN